MPAKPPPNDPVHSRSMSDEADIGSGEKSPGQHDTDALIKQIPPLPDDGQAQQIAAPGNKAGGGEECKPGGKPGAQP